MNRTDRLLAIVLELQRNGSQRAEDLAATFETSKRTIYRDIQALSESGVPVVAQAGKGYSLVEGYFLPPLSFSTDEAAMLLLGGKLVADHFEAQYREVSQSASRKIETVLSEKLRAEVGFLRDNIAFVAPETLASSTSAKFLPTLRRAILEQKTIRFHYHTRYSMDRSTAKKTREADPYSLLHYGDAWYLNGFCHLRQALRQFRLDRMSDLELLDKSFTRPADYKMAPPEEDDRQVIVRALFNQDAAPWVRESRSYYVTEMLDDPEGRPGCLLVTMKAHFETEVISWLLSWGAKVEVLEPESLKRRLAGIAREIHEKYSD
ncbi:MAG TPA: YafY family protein [Blastocatellia bacterium]|nr:YafY family protein [Blastocatellia bacterium]HMV83409.1 YafY family protein [Blastocatellia bacterium]HMY73230.1 YafY family protein [Blastocatellia bacterium]HMZ20400.1 YafY family protein [Blastocatellia bacterium]HNG28116.1 YafY family protein [Blastocatellia bacterium]